MCLLTTANPPKSSPNVGYICSLQVLSDIVMPDLQTQETEGQSSLEINFFIGKLKHTVKRVRKEKGNK